MADRRMFAKTIIDSDAFLDMPMSARCLYFTFGMLADDDGFVGNPKAIMRQCGATSDDLKILLAKRYVLGFESGVIVIKHWRMNNYLQNDRHKATTYVEELSTLTTDKKGSYTEIDKPCIQNVYTGKDSIDKVSKGNNIPTLEDIIEYCKSRKNNVDAKRFYDYYTTNDWKDSKGKKVKNWKLKVITWESHNDNKIPDFTVKKREDENDIESIRKKIGL